METSIKTYVFITTFELLIKKKEYLVLRCHYYFVVARPRFDFLMYLHPHCRRDYL